MPPDHYAPGRSLSLYRCGQVLLQQQLLQPVRGNNMPHGEFGRGHAPMSRMGMPIVLR